MGKLDTAGIDFLEGEPLVRPKVAKKPVKPATRRVTTVPPGFFEGISSYRLVRELSVRHYRFVVSGLFWAGVGAAIVIITRG